MSVLRRILDILRESNTQLETYGRSGDLVRALSGGDFARCVARSRPLFRGWSTPSYEGHHVIALLFRPEETIEFLVATFAAIAEGFTVVPFYPNWDSETQLLHLKQYRIRSLAVGAGFVRRAEGWSGQLDRVVKISVDPGPARAGEHEEPYPDDLSDSHPCAWIFTSGTSGEIPKCTLISLRNIDAAVENIRRVDFLREGMSLHSPLSTSHIFAFAVVLGMLAVKPRRLLFSDVQYLARLSQERIGRIDGVILVPLVLNRLRSGFYEKLVAARHATDPSLARLPRALRRGLLRCAQFAERTLVGMESGVLRSFAGWPAVALTRALFGRTIARRLGSPDFVVVGGAKPNLQAMAFLDVMGIRCLQGWGMTETTGALAVCGLRDRFRGAYGTCGRVFHDTEARVEEGELVVSGPQIAEGYIEPDGRFLPFAGVKRTGDSAEFDRRGRLRVTGKTTDRITLANGLNYNPLVLEELIMASDIAARNALEEAVVVGDGQPRLGCVFFVKQSADGSADGGGAVPQADLRPYLTDLLRRVNASRPVDEQIGPWAIHPLPIRDTDLIGPSGKLRRRLVEERSSDLFAPLRRPEVVTE